MLPIISIVGKSGSGKTTLLEKLIAELKQRGFRVGIIKHSEKFELDTEQKDSWRFSRVGSDVVAISSPAKVAVIRNVERDLSPQEISAFVGMGCDIILTEGFKKSRTPKIEVHRKEQGGGLLCPPAQLLAVVTDEPLEVPIPQFSRDDIKPLADLVEANVRAQAKEERVELLINDTAVQVSPYVQDLISRTLVAMTLGLRGADNINSVQISLRKEA